MFWHVAKLALLIALLGTQIFFTPAHAQPTSHRYLDGDDLAWFYNKPGVTLERYRDDEQHCSRIASVALGPTPTAGTYGSGVVTSIFHASLTPGWHNALFDSCMRVREYRRFEMRPGNQRTFIQELSQADDDMLRQYVSDASPPVGVLTSEWRNEFLGSTTSVYALDRLSPPAPTELLSRGQVFQRDFHYMRNRGAPELVSGDVLDPGLATIVLAMSVPDGVRTAFNTNTLAFLRIDPVSSNAPTDNNHPTFINLGEWNRNRERGRFQVFQVPPGRYALWRYTDREVVTADFCLRTVGFDVGAGDVVYAGRWHLPGSGAIDVTMDDAEAAQTALQTISPQLSGNIQRATYHNGIQLPCGSQLLRFFFHYGIDLPMQQ